MSDPFTAPANLSGSLIVAHPSLLDENFRKTVVLISSHTDDDGALGTVLNRPLRKTLSDLNPIFGEDPLGRVPLYQGGPVATDELLLMAWKWSPEEGVFRLAYGLNPDQAREHLEEAGYELRAFLGYSGWGRGQLEQELAHGSWLVSGMEAEHLQGGGAQLWRRIVSGFGAEMQVQAQAPEDPSLN